MEELRSTDILDREIQEDARRKAEKVLKTSEAECRQILDAVSSRLDAVRAEKEIEYAKRLAAYQRDVDAAIPLEKERRLVSYIDEAVQKALDAWYGELGDDRRLALYGDMLVRRKSAFEDASVVVLSTGFTEVAVIAIANKIFSPVRVDAVRVLSRAEAVPFGFTDGLVVETVDGGIRCRATKEELRATLLSEKRQELAEALFGGRLPE